MPKFRPTLMTLLAFMFIASILSSVLILSQLHISVVNDFFEDKTKSTLESRVLAIEDMLNREINSQKAFFMAVKQHPQIIDLFRKFGELKERDGISPPYPMVIRDWDAYRAVISYFAEVSSYEPSLEMLRTFWKDGNVVAGVVYGSEDIMDYKGDKEWFRLVISGNASGSVYVSPINIARHTNTPAIRYVSPVVVDGRIVGLVIANYNFKKTFSLIKDIYWEEGEHILIIDPSYENAEGEVLGPRFIVNTYDPRTEFNESCPVCPLVDIKEFPGQNGFVKFRYGGEKTLYGYYRWTTLENGREYLIICAVTPETFAAVTNDIKKTAVIGATAIGAVFVLASIFMSRFLLNPIEDIIMKARVIASGAYYSKVSVHRGYREAEVLSRAIKEMQESLLSYLRKIEEFGEGLKLVNSVIRHDTINHLTAAMNYLDFYRETGDEDYLEKLRVSLRRVSETLRVSKVLEAVMETGERKRVRVANLVSKVAERYPEVNVVVEGDCEILADDGMEVVFDNLIQNAIKHGKAKNLFVKIVDDREWCTITVSDDGVGIPDELKGQIFEKGFSTSGTGLGLFITKLILSRYDGEIRVEDNEPKGARFVIKIRKF
ncbi:Signal transduction histidine kinase [Geoglobus ahangari]|uniref:histidine kinase n=1 Tax=Geoglobus ahangari TaxID=113653 RepID=A0A0F7DBK0_9EURY|nr:sensor histidine kinase [Geoglobus ahangari]AKG91226.1 Signal transduction histidine kinase [Geoglobus ahangari]